MLKMWYERVFVQTNKTLANKLNKPKANKIKTIDTNSIIFQIVFQIMFFFCVRLSNFNYYYLHEFGYIEQRQRKCSLSAIVLEKVIVYLYFGTNLRRIFFVLHCFLQKHFDSDIFLLFYCFQNANLFIEEKCRSQLKSKQTWEWTVSTVSTLKNQRMTVPVSIVWWRHLILNTRRRYGWIYSNEGGIFIQKPIEYRSKWIEEARCVEVLKKYYKILYFIYK